MTLGSLRAFLQHGERHEDSSGVCEGGDTYFLFVQRVDLPHCIHPARVLHSLLFPPCSGLQGLWSKPQGMLPDMLVSPVLH